MGKSTFVQNIAENAARNNKVVLEFNLEMTATEKAEKTISALGSVDFGTIKRGMFDDNEFLGMTSAIAQISDSNYYINDKSSHTVLSIRAEAKRIARKHGKIDLLVIDYLQLIEDHERGRTAREKINDITRELKKLAKDELKCPIILLSQLNRDCEKRHDKRPHIGDLKESGSIEQDADIIMLLYRDKYYAEQSGQQSQYGDITEVIVGKARGASKGVDYLEFQGHFQRFTNCNQDEAKSINERMNQKPHKPYRKDLKW